MPVVMLRLCQAHFLCYSVHCRYCVTRYSNGNRRVLVKIYDHYMLRTEKVGGIPHPVALLDELFLYCQGTRNLVTSERSFHVFWLANLKQGKGEDKLSPLLFSCPLSMSSMSSSVCSHRREEKVGREAGGYFQ